MVARKTRKIALRPGELPLGEDVGSQGVEEGLQDGHRGRDERAVGEPSPVAGALTPLRSAEVTEIEELAVAGRREMVRDPMRRHGEDLAQVLEGCADQPCERRDEDDRPGDQDEVDDPAGPAPLRCLPPASSFPVRPGVSPAPASRRCHQAHGLVFRLLGRRHRSALRYRRSWINVTTNSRTNSPNASVLAYPNS